MKRTVVIRIISFFLLAACGALCQIRPSADLLAGSLFDGPNSPGTNSTEAQHQFPDAPSPVQPPSEPTGFQTFIEPVSSPSVFRPAALGAGLSHQTTSGQRTSLPALYQAAPFQKESAGGAFLGRYLYPLLRKPAPRNEPVASGSFIGRAFQSASRMVVTRDDSGKRKPNTSYLIRTLTSAAIDFASPSGAQSASSAYVIHDGPGVRPMVKRPH